MLKKLIGGRITFLRKQQNLTQQQLADILEIEKQYMFRIEQGQVNITADYTDKIIKALNTSHKDFFIFHEQTMSTQAKSKSNNSMSP